MKARINESQLRNIIAESIKKILNEGNSYCRDYGRFEFCPDDYCSEEEAEILEQCGIEFQYEINCSRDCVHMSGSHEQPPYDENFDISIEDDGGFEQDMEAIKDAAPEVYQKIMDGFNSIMDNPDSSVDWYDSETL